MAVHLFGVAKITLCFTISLSVVFGDEHEHPRHHDHKSHWHAEKLADMYYKYPLDYVSKYNPNANHNIRKRNWCHYYEKLTADFPCIRGVNPIGFDTKESIDDGHKFGCGISYISGNPIVYSFGSNQQQDFEIAFLQMRPDSNIFTFDILESHLPKVSVRHNSITYSLTGLGGYDEVTNLKSDSLLKPLANIMIDRNHSYIDVLKVDIEGAEWAWIEREPYLLERIGQLLIEVHIGCDDEMVNLFHLPNKDFFYMVETFELYGLRMFYKELNPMWPECCSEFSFIQKEWGKWDEEKLNFAPLKEFVPVVEDASINGKAVQCEGENMVYKIENMLRRPVRNGADYPVNHKGGFDFASVIQFSAGNCEKFQKLRLGPTFWYHD